MRKAVPPGVAPAATWRMGADRPLLSHPSLIGTGPRGNQLMLPRISKMPSSLGWPNGAKMPLGPVAFGALDSRIRLAKPFVPSSGQNHTSAFGGARPQFAYTLGRGTMDALLRAHGHMQDVRSLIQDNRKSICAKVPLTRSPDHSLPMLC